MKNLTIKSPAEADLQAFEALKTSTGKKLTAAAVLGLLLSKPPAAPDQAGFTNTDYLALKSDYENLEHQNTTLENQNVDLTAKVTNLETRLAETLTLLEAAAAAQETLKVNLPDFICKPSAELAHTMRQVRPAFYKDGLTKNVNPADYENEFAIYSMRYFLLNNYPKFLQA